LTVKKIGRTYSVFCHDSHDVMSCRTQFRPSSGQSHHQLQKCHDFQC